MIAWKDFVQDELLGFSLKSEKVGGESRDARTGIRTDAKTGESHFQETRRGQRPARMAGSTSLIRDSQGSMEADCPGEAVSPSWEAG